MRRIVSVIAVLSLWGCGSEHGPEGTLVKPGTGVVGVPGDGYAVKASRAVPVSGGTLLVTRGGVAVAADPDRDQVFIANLETQRVTPVALQSGDEPGRLAEDDAGRVHVATRSGGSVVSIDLASAKVVDRRAVCPAPRGIAHDSATGLLHVACQTGELVSLPAAGGEAVRVLKLNRDLRDVLVRGTELLVSRFKTAQLLVVDAEGRVTNTVSPPSFDGGFVGNPGTRTPSVAWRMVELPDKKIGMLHQRGTLQMVSTSPSGYGGGGDPCGGGAIVDGTLSQLTVPEGPATSTPPNVASPSLNAMVGPSDVAVSPGGRVAVVSIGNSWFANPPLTTNGDLPPMPGPMRQRKPKIAIVDPGAGPPDPNTPPPCAPAAEDAEITGEPMAVAFHGEQIVVQSREPAQLQLLSAPGRSPVTISLSTDSRADTGLALFHMDAGPGLACASCHPEGMEDGRVWEFAGLGSRRTQNLGGGIMNTAPFHWAGDLADFPSLVHEVFESRMGSARPNHLQLAAFSDWLDRVPAVIPAATDATVADRGRAVFESPEAGCSTCHSGAQFTNNQTVDVGTGGLFQVPSLLGIGSRAPFMHHGLAPTLRDRFGAHGGGDLHGTTSALSAAQIDDLVTYLESL